MQSKDFTASTLASLKQAGMDRMVSIFRPDKKATYVIYPGVQSYLIIPLAKGEAEALEKGLKLEKTALGKETIDGHPCVKNKVVVKNDKGPVLEAVTWNATDLKDFPLQIEMKEKDNTVLMHFTAGPLRQARRQAIRRAGRLWPDEMKIINLNPDTAIGATAWFVEMEGHRLLMDAGTHPRLEGRGRLAAL